MRPNLTTLRQKAQPTRR